ncbi:MAG: DNA alkylation repair protein [Acidobacteria bacterium]|nr:DNA alkylation repair protein [Acidobacteriota bacterium]
MTKTAVMKELRAAGTAQTKKTLRNHGVQDPTFGVSYAVLRKLARRIKTDQKLATALWATGNYDAKTLATLIADPSAMSATKLHSWARDLSDRHLAGALSNVAGEAAAAKSLAAKWIRSRNEMIATCGWHTLATLARADDGGPTQYFLEHLQQIEARIHVSPNWVRYAMNNALINIGVRNKTLERRAVAAANRIGKVEVDHGVTSCKTPAAAAYIKKTLAHREAKAQRAGSR